MTIADAAKEEFGPHFIHNQDTVDFAIRIAAEKLRNVLNFVSNEPLGYRTMEEHELLEIFAEKVIARIRLEINSATF